MAFETTRYQRAQNWRLVSTLFAAALSISSLQVIGAGSALAQVKAPNKNHLKASTRAAAPAQPAEDVQPFFIGADGNVAGQLVALNIDPNEAQSAAQAVSKALEQLDRKTTSSGRAVLQAQGAGQPKRLVALQLYSATSLAVELHRGSDGSYGYKLAPNATENDDERVSSLPSAAQQNTVAARSLVQGSVALVKASAVSGLAASLGPAGANDPSLKELTQAFSGFSMSATKIEVWKGRTVDGSTRLLAASIGDGANKQSYWWFAPPSQPEGWFDENGRRLGGTGLTDPTQGARMSSPFGTRRYYGRYSGGGFHNGLDFEGKTGQPIYAAADGVINHQGWYFNYGRTVKLSHADNFETLYAHMSRFADGMGPGSRVRKGDLIGYIGSTGRSSGPHLHFSVIVNGQFVDPQPYLAGSGGINVVLSGESLVAYRQWQQDIRKAAGVRDDNGGGRFRGLQGAEPWSQNPFSSRGLDRL